MFDRPTYRMTRRLVQKVKDDPRTQSEHAIRSSIPIPHMSSYMHGESFGDSVRQRVLALGATLGLSATHAIVPAGVPVEDEDVFVDLESRYAVIFDYWHGRATVADEQSPGVRTSFVDFRAQWGDAIDKWLMSPHRRAFSEESWARYLAEKGGVR